MSKVLVKPTIKNIINKQIGLRIFFSFFLLFTYVVWQSTQQINNYMNELQINFDKRVDDLSNFIISQELIPNKESINLALNEFSYGGSHIFLNKEKEYIKHRVYRFPFDFIYYFPIREINNIKFGTLIISYNILSNRALLIKTFFNIFILILAWISVLIVMFPLYKKIPNELIIFPINQLLDILKSRTVKINQRIDMPIKEFQELSNYLHDYLKKKELEYSVITEHNIAKELNKKTRETIHDLKIPLFTLEKILNTSGLREKEYKRIEKVAFSLKYLLSSLQAESEYFFEDNSHVLSVINNVITDYRFLNDNISFILTNENLMRDKFINVNSFIGTVRISV